jgi:hypothetical protein
VEQRLGMTMVDVAGDRVKGTAGCLYTAYGVAIASDSPLALPPYSGEGFGRVTIQRGTGDLFAASIKNATDQYSDSWHRYAVLPDGAAYVCWGAVGEFIVSSNGRRILCRRFPEASRESFQVYLLGHALSFALVQQQLEPLHATAVVVDGRAVAFVGSSGFGKSSVAARFLSAGYPIVTDDLLVLQPSGSAVFAHPGPPRIKLFPKVAARFLAGVPAGTAMNGGTEKLVLPIADALACRTPVPMAAIYVLAAPRDACRVASTRIEPLSTKDAFVELLKATFNRRLVTPGRLAHQFDLLSRIAAAVPIRKLSYRRSFDQLERLPDLVAADIEARAGRGAA